MRFIGKQNPTCKIKHFIDAWYPFGKEPTDSVCLVTG